MIISLDTTYFMYGFNISPKPAIPQNVLDIFSENTNITEIIFSDLVIFELNAKASKIIQDCVDFDYKTNLLVNLETNTKFKLIKSSESKIWEIACFLRKFHKDFVDCIHWATAIQGKAKYFLSEDELLGELTNRESFQDEFLEKFNYSLPPIVNFTNWSKKFIDN